MNEQLPLPGVPPAEEQASPEDTATTQLIYMGDDKVIERVVEAIRTLFWTTPDADPLGTVRGNARAFVRQLFDSVEVRNLMLSALEPNLRVLIRDEIIKARKELQTLNAIKPRYYNKHR